MTGKTRLCLPSSTGIAWKRNYYWAYHPSVVVLQTSSRMTSFLSKKDVGGSMMNASRISARREQSRLPAWLGPDRVLVPRIFGFKHDGASSWPGLLDGSNRVGCVFREPRIRL